MPNRPRRAAARAPKLVAGELVRIYPRRDLRESGGYIPGVPDEGADVAAAVAQGFIDAGAATTDGPPYPVEPAATPEAPADPAESPAAPADKEPA